MRYLVQYLWNEIQVYVTCQAVQSSRNKINCNISQKKTNAMRMTLFDFDDGDENKSYEYSIYLATIVLR